MPATYALRPRFRKLPPKAAHVLAPMILSFFMSGVVVSIATLRTVGLAPDLAEKILHGWMLSYPVAFPAALLAVPVVRRIVGMMVETPQSSPRGE